MPFIFWIITCASLGGIIYGYDLGVFSGTIYFIRKDIHLSLEQIDMLGGIVFFGGLLGTMATGYLSDRFGRRIMILIGSLLFSVGVLLVVYQASFYHMLFGRLIAGLAVGILSVAIVSYLSEIAPSPIRGKSVTLFQLFLTAGILLAYLADTLLGHTGSWKAMYALSLIPAVILFITLLFLPESPRWLACNGREKEALKVLKLTRPHAEAAKEMYEILNPPQETTSRWRDLFTGRQFIPLLTLLAVAILNQLTAINSILLYAPHIFMQAGFSSNHSAMEGAVMIGAVNFISTLIGTRLVDRLGRRLLLMLGTAGITLGYIFLAIISPFNLAPVYTLCGFLWIIFTFAFGPGTVVWLILTELLPTHIRGKGVALGLFANSMASWALASVFLTLNNRLGNSLTYAVFASFMVIYFIVGWKLVPETSHRSLEQIQKDMDADYAESH
jgi:SP family galactose:H+ symporter-like MFS transporter